MFKTHRGDQAELRERGLESLLNKDKLKILRVGDTGFRYWRIHTMWQKGEAWAMLSLGEFKSQE